MTPIVELDLESEPVEPGTVADPGSLAVRGQGSGRPVVFLHGQPGGSEIWSAVQDLLADSGVRTLALDRPGYGSTSLEAGGFRHNAEVLAEVLAHLGEPAVVVAHSWASGPALLTARRTPELISGLVLCAPVGDTRSVTAPRPGPRPRPRRSLRAAGGAGGGWMAGAPSRRRAPPQRGRARQPPAGARPARPPSRRSTVGPAGRQRRAVGAGRGAGRGPPCGPLGARPDDRDRRQPRQHRAAQGRQGPGPGDAEGPPAHARRWPPAADGAPAGGGRRGARPPGRRRRPARPGRSLTRP